VEHVALLIIQAEVVRVVHETAPADGAGTLLVHALIALVGPLILAAVYWIHKNADRRALNDAATAAHTAAETSALNVETAMKEFRLAAEKAAAVAAKKIDDAAQALAAKIASDEVARKAATVTLTVIAENVKKTELNTNSLVEKLLKAEGDKRAAEATLVEKAAEQVRKDAVVSMDVPSVKSVDKEGGG